MEKSGAKSIPTAEANARVAEEPQRSGPELHPLLQLQTAIGNQAVQRFLQGRIIQAKQAVSHPSDAHEQEADRIAEHAERGVSTPEPQLQRACDCGGGCPACQTKSGDLKLSQRSDHAEIEADQIADRAMRMAVGEEMPVTNAGNAGSMIYRKCSACEEAEEKIPRKALSSGQSIPSHGPAHVQNAISTGGEPLDAQTRDFFEPRLGYDLSNVRIHTDSTAGQSARAIDAKAYTLGNNIVFGSGEYRPGSEGGKHLIAHELAHIAQSGSSSDIRRDTIYRQPDETGGDLAAMDYEIQQLSEIPVMGAEAAPVMMRLAQLQEQRNRLLARGAGAPIAPTVVCTDKDRALNISKQRNKCLTVNQRWALYKAHADEVANREDDRGRKLEGVADWSTYVTQEEFNRLDTQRTYRDLYDTYLKYYAGGGQYEQQQQERKAQEEASKPSPPTKEQSSGGDFSFLSEMRQIDIDRMFQERNRFGFTSQLAEPPPPPTVETGCHTDPYARHPASTVCGQKRPDEATQAAMRAMQSPALDLDEFKKQQRARLDRLNALYLEARRTQTFPATNEFSQYEIALDREVDVTTRWQISAEEHGVGENDLELDHYNTLLFRSRYEYDREYRRRENMHKEEVKCESGHGIKLPKLSRKHPEWIDCENEVNAEYYPRAHAQKEAARWKAYLDIQVAMPVLTEAGPVAAFGFHIAHEYLGWSTERSAAFGGALSTATGIGLLKTQQVFSLRNAGQSVAPPDEMTPPPEHIAPPPGRYPAPPPGKPPVLQTEPPPAPVKQLQTEPPPAPVKQLQTEPPPAPVKQLQTEPPPAPGKQLQTEPPPAPVKQLQTEPPPAPVKQSQTEPPPAPLRQQLRQNLEAAVNKIEKDIADVSAAKGRVQRQLVSINEQLKTATKEEKGRLIELREKLKRYQDENLGSGGDLGQKLLDAKQLLRGNESDYFKALTSAASKKAEYVSVKNRKVDEVFKTAEADLEVEHVYPRSKIWNTPGFVEKLSWKQQIAVFNYAKNLKLMSAKANLARSNIPYRSLPRKIWSRFTSDESVITNLGNLEAEVQRDIEAMIKNPSLIPLSD